MENTKLLNQLENIASKVNLEYVPELAGLINELKAEIYSESNGKINKSRQTCRIFYQICKN